MAPRPVGCLVCYLADSRVRAWAASGMCDGWQIRAWLGWVLLATYLVFMVAVVLVIQYAPADWRMPGGALEH
eukprot:COSAG01_NODE_4431_length_5031_cov_3.383539_5_plen_72_part_00